MSNKAVKTRKVKKKKLNIKKVFFLLCFISAFIVLFNIISKIKVSTIKVSGNDYLSSKSIIKELELNEHPSYIGSTNSKICKKLTKNYLINTCYVKHNKDLSITIEISENKPLFYYNNDQKLALSNGKFIDSKNIYGVPTLVNYVPNKILKKLISGLKDIDSDIIRSTSEIEYSPSQNGDGSYIDEGRFVLSMNDGNTVYINNKHIDVLNYYKKVYASIGDKRGTYYFDCDFDNYYFEEYTS